MNKNRKPRVYPKAWAKDYTYLRSPHSNVVHLCYRHQARIKDGMETRTASPMCGTWCWKRVVPVLVEDIENNPELRLCKNCLRYAGDEFWMERFARRADYLSLEHCMVELEETNDD